MLCRPPPPARMPMVGSVAPMTGPAMGTQVRGGPPPPARSTRPAALRKRHCDALGRSRYTPTGRGGVREDRKLEQRPLQSSPGKIPRIRRRLGILRGPAHRCVPKVDHRPGHPPRDRSACAGDYLHRRRPAGFSMAGGLKDICRELLSRGASRQPHRRPGDGPSTREATRRATLGKSTQGE
jgi:hypothetical protein